jgi:thiol-disulfide isomerase/thioredoxin
MIANNDKEKRTARYYPGRRWKELYPTSQLTFIEKLREALSRIGASDESTRNIVGKALRHAGLGFDLWANWCSNCASYNPVELKNGWEGFGSARNTYTGGLDVVFGLANRFNHGR